MVAILLGFISLFLLFVLGETLGEKAAFVGVGGYALLAQFFLSRGHREALRKDWPIILCLNWLILLSTAICVAIEPNPAAKLTTSLLAIVAVACSYAGAGLAARIARNRTTAV